MKIALSQVLKLPKFFEELTDKRMTVQVLYDIFRLKRKMEEGISFYEESVKKIIIDCARYDDNGELMIDSMGRTLIDKAHIDECATRVQELADCLIEFPDIFFEIEDFNQTELTLEGFEAILPFIKQKEDHH